MKIKKDIDVSEEQVIIKLKRWQIPYLLGAARLGIWTEDWCAGLDQTRANCYDTHSARWICRIDYIIDLIKNQTEITDEYKEYGGDWALGIIEEWVNEECKRNEELAAEDEIEYLKKHDEGYKESLAQQNTSKIKKVKKQTSVKTKENQK